MIGGMGDAALNSTAGGQPVFASTQWGLLLATAAGHAGDGAAAAATKTVWEDLYRIYCYPVYAFIRRRGQPRAAAQDLTQDFFIHLMEKDTLTRVDPRKGRFRTFLLGSLEYFLVDAARRESARKRGGGLRPVFLDDTAESEYQLAAPAWESPERLFDARWAAALLGTVFTRLREEMTAAGKGALFEALKDYVAGVEDASYQETADKLGLSLAALKSNIHRLRIRYSTLLREEVARTVANLADVDEELRHLRAALRVI